MVVLGPTVGSNGRSKEREGWDMGGGNSMVSKQSKKEKKKTKQNQVGAESGKGDIEKRGYTLIIHTISKEVTKVMSVPSAKMVPGAKERENERG